MINGNCMKPISGLLQVVVYKCGSGFRSICRHCFVCIRTIFGGLSKKLLRAIFCYTNVLFKCFCNVFMLVFFVFSLSVYPVGSGGRN